MVLVVLGGAAPGYHRPVYNKDQGEDKARRDSQRNLSLSDRKWSSNKLPVKRVEEEMVFVNFSIPFNDPRRLPGITSV